MRSTCRGAALTVLCLAAALGGTASAHIPGTEQHPAWNWTELYQQRPMAQGAAQMSAAGIGDQEPQPTPEAACGPGSNPSPSDMTGRVPADAVAAGKADKGFTRNASLVGREGTGGGFKVERFVDKAGHECAYYDTTLLFPTNPGNPGQDPAQGVAVLDMTNPAKPVRTATLVTQAMESPHESLLLNQKRGLLVAVWANLSANPGVIDVYDVNADCRHPVLQSTGVPSGVLGHESGFAPDGLTYYATSLFNGSITGVDLTNPMLPNPVWVDTHISHGLTVSDDGNRAYLAADFGLMILDISQVQARVPDPQAPEVSRLTWKRLSIPQVAQPVTINGKPYLVEVDEFSVGPEGGRLPADNGPNVGAARIIDISDEKNPKVVSNLRLDVHQEKNRAAIAGDPGASGSSGYVQGFAGHYCTVPRRKDPGIVACSMIASGLRVFDIRDPESPREIAYFVAPFGENGGSSNWAMSGPAYNLDRREIWYSDGNSGFYAVKISDAVWPFGVKGRLVRSCPDKRRFAFRLHHDRGARVVRAVVYVNGKRKLTRRGRSLKRMSIGRLPRRRFVVKIVSTQSNGVKRISRRTYTGCTQTAPRTRRVKP